MLDLKGRGTFLSRFHPREKRNWAVKKIKNLLIWWDAVKYLERVRMLAAASPVPFPDLTLVAGPKEEVRGVLCCPGSHVAWRSK